MNDPSLLRQLPRLRQLPFLRRADDGARPLLALHLPEDAPLAPRGLALEVQLPGCERRERCRFETAIGELRFTVPPGTRGPVRVRLGGLLATPQLEAEVVVGDDADARRTLLVVASAHTDLGYTALQEQVAQVHSTNIETALALADRFPGFVWNLEVLWQLDAHRELAGEAAFRRAVDAIREGRLGASALYLLMLTGFLTGRMLARYTDFAVELRRTHGLALAAATFTDIPTAVATWPAFLKRAGVRWLIHGVNNYGAVPWRPEELAGRPGPVRWVAPGGESVVVWWSRWPQDRPAFGPGYAQLQALGLAGSGVVNLRVPDGERAVEHFLRDHAAVPRGLPLLVHGAYFENTLLTDAVPRTVAAFRAKYAAPEIRFTTAEGFFRETLGDDLDGRGLPEVRGGGGSYWEEGIGSTARETGQFRESMGRCERLEDISRRRAPAANGAGAEVVPDSIVKPLILFGEHTWGAAESVTRPDSASSRSQLRWKMRRLQEARLALQVETKARLGAAANEVMTQTGVSHRGPRLLIDHPGPAPLAEPFEVTVPRDLRPLDERGRELAHARLASFAGHERLLVQPATPLAAGRTAAFALGPVTSVPRSRVSAARDGRFASPLLVVAGGCELVVSETGRVDLRCDGHPVTDPAAPFGLGEYVYAAGGDCSRIVHTEWIDGAMTFYEEMPELQLHRPRWERATVESTPLGERLLLEGAAEKSPCLRLSLFLHGHSSQAGGRIDLELHVRRVAERRKEAAYLALPFLAAEPRLRFAVPGGECDYTKDLLPGAARDWICVERWLRLDDAAKGPGRGVTIVTTEAALFTVGDLFRGEWAPARPASGRLFAWLMNNYWPTNYAAEQSGWSRFRLSLRLPVAADDGARLDEDPLVAAGFSAPLATIVTG